MRKQKPKVFIGSARESIDYVNALHEALSYYAEVTPWFAGVFNVNDYTMESLEQQLDANDYAVFIFSPDDTVKMREKTMLKTRDNTLFELGLFWGKLRKGRVFFIVPNEFKTLNSGNDDYVLPTDLSGLTTLNYEMRTDNNFEAAVSRAAQKINTIIRTDGFFEDPSVLLEKTKEDLIKCNTLLSFYHQFTKSLIGDSNKKYEHLYEAFRSTYYPPEGFNVAGAGVWKVAENEGLELISGNEGRNSKFYAFNINDDRQKGNEILVVDSFLSSVEQVTLLEDTLIKTYLICYPIGKDLVLTVHIRGTKLLQENELDQLFLTNHELMSTINYLFGGLLNE
ncbi:nucleotide-binding protein [Ureibacillus chungkukjangi]|uniref:TIR domain-containing protein n=1 Tax=Ureibacillus chungkukjangi TaxID=1202712 RepID=UPI00384C050D